MREAVPGDVVALTGLKSARTGDTYAERDGDRQISTFRFPEPIISVSIEPADGGDSEKLADAARHLCNEDPTLSIRYDTQVEELILSGMGQLHLEVATDRLRSEFGVSARTGTPRIAYRETIRRTVEAAGEYRKQTGGRGHFAVVRLRVEPTEPGSGVTFHVAPGALVSIGSPEVSGRGKINGLFQSHVKPIENGFRAACESCLHSEYPVTDIRGVLIGGRHHGYDSAPRDFEIAASLALREALRIGHTNLLEPIMSVTVRVDTKYLGPVTADLGRRRAKINSLESTGSRSEIRGESPLAEMQEYATALRDVTEGRGTFFMEFLCYRPKP
jgi:elongation factor G